VHELLWADLPAPRLDSLLFLGTATRAPSPRLTFGFQSLPADGVSTYFVRLLSEFRFLLLALATTCSLNRFK
jgi:hypothetical protein